MERRLSGGKNGASRDNPYPVIALRAQAEEWPADFEEQEGARQIEQARRLGREAKERGESKDDNPYYEGELHDAWNEGWEGA